MKFETRNKKKKSRLSYSVFSLFIIVFLLSIVSAGTFKQWDAVEIRHPIRLDGAVSSTILANITIKDPDNLVIVGSSPMTFDPASEEHNFTLVGGNTGKLGTYTYSVTASSANQNLTKTFSLDITPSGDKGLLGYYFLVIILSYGVLGLGIYKSDITISMLGTFALYFVGIWILFNGIDVFKNFLTEGFAILTLGVAFYVSARAAHEYIV